MSKFTPYEMVEWFYHEATKENQGYIEPSIDNVSYVPQYPLDRFAQESAPETWRNLFTQEVEWASEDGREGFYDDMLTEEIYDPICITEIDGKPFIHDGFHRVCASFYKQAKSIPAIVVTA